LITYLATLVPHLDEPLRRAVVAGAVGGGGLTVIANAPNPAGQAILSRHFDDAVAPLRLLAGAAVPTLVIVVVFSLI
jgi:Na+/H+ antiporter NhaD/arsenite permease-like protein